MTLDECKLHTKARILRIHGNTSIKNHLLTMGCVPNTLLTIHTISPFKDPIIITIRNYQLILRLEIARLIEVEVL